MSDVPYASDIVCQEQVTGVTFHLPPVGFRYAGGGTSWGCGKLMVVSIVSGGFGILFTIVFLLNPPNPLGLGDVFGLYLFAWAIPTATLVAGWHIGQSRAVLAVRDGMLVMDFLGPLRNKHVELRRGDINSISQDFKKDITTTSGPSERIPVLLIETTPAAQQGRDFGIVRRKDPRFREFLAGRTKAELAWIAAKLQQALELSPAPSMNFMRWVKRQNE